MNNAFVFYGQQTQLIERIKSSLEEREDFECFEIEQGSELAQIIGMATSEKNKALVMFSNLKEMSDANRYIKETFSDGKALGLLLSKQKPMHPLLAKAGSNFHFQSEEEDFEKIIEKMETFHAMGFFTDQAKPKEIIKENFNWNSLGSNHSQIIDTNSRQRIERLAHIEEDLEETIDGDAHYQEFHLGNDKAPSSLNSWNSNNFKDRDSISFNRFLPSNAHKGVFSFARSINKKLPTIDRAKAFIEQWDIKGYTKESLERNPDPIEILESKEEIYYENECELFQYLPMFAEMISKRRLKKSVMHRLIRLVLEKEFSCFVDFFKVQDEFIIEDSSENINPPKPKEISKWDTTIPQWEDITFSKGKNKFIMPYSVSGECKALAVAYFQDSRLNQKLASTIEAMLFLCRGMYK